MISANLSLRFLLEMTAVGSVAVWGWRYGEANLKWVLMFLCPLILMIVWGLFNVPGDPSRSGEAPVVVPGLVRLILELSIFAVGGWALYDLQSLKLFFIYVLLVVLHYAFSLDRIQWLLER